ncbi:hypothetical protein [Paraoerskovia marina]|nr:hypothetical protein [Paraoerskovia marina]
MADDPCDRPAPSLLDAYADRLLPETAAVWPAVEGDGAYISSFTVLEDEFGYSAALGVPRADGRVESVEACVALARSAAHHVCGIDGEVPFQVREIEGMPLTVLVFGDDDGVTFTEERDDSILAHDAQVWVLADDGRRAPVVDHDGSTTCAPPFDGENHPLACHACAADGGRGWIAP